MLDTAFWMLDETRNAFFFIYPASSIAEPRRFEAKLRQST